MQKTTAWKPPKRQNLHPNRQKQWIFQIIISSLFIEKIKFNHLTHSATKLVNLYLKFQDNLLVAHTDTNMFL